MQPVRFEIYLDLAGWVSRETIGTDRITVAAVAINAEVAPKLREAVRGGFSKWKSCTLEEASAMADLLCTYASGVAICSFTKTEPAWGDFWSAAKSLHEAIVSEDRRAAGFIKPGNAARFAMFVNAMAGAMAYAVRTNQLPTLRTSSGLSLYERSIVSDSDLQGDENIEVFKHLCFTSDDSQPRINQLGMHWVTKSVEVATEQQEPLLLLADFAAGIGHSAHIRDPGRIPLPVDNRNCQRLIRTLVSTGRVGVIDQPFSYRYEEMFGDAYLEAVEITHARSS